MAVTRKSKRISSGSSQNRTKHPVVRAKVQAYGRKQIKQGKHPQKWRKGRPSLGPMGELGDDVIVEVKLSPHGTTMLNQKLSKGLSRNNLWVELYNTVYENEDGSAGLLPYLKKLIWTWAPADTTALRKSLENALTPSGGSLVEGFPFKLILNTEGIPYAKPVNQMPIEYIKHEPGQTHHKLKGRTRKNLHDPKVKKGWYNLILVDGRKRAKRLMIEYLKKVADLLEPIFSSLGVKGTSYNEAQRWFNIKFI